MVELYRPDRVLATPMHFAGDGLTVYGTVSNNQKTGNYPIDQGVDQVYHRTFYRLALRQYVPALRRHHVGSVMPSYSDVDWTEDGLGNPINMHAEQDLIQGWLKRRQGFDGFVISDYNGIDHIDAGVPGTTFATRVRKGVNAGIDMFMQPLELRAVREHADRRGQRGQRADEPDQRRRQAHPDQEVRARGSSSTPTRTAGTSTRSARRSTARWHAGPSPNRRCC